MTDDSSENVVNLWGGEEPEKIYSPDKFYTRATNQKGFKDNIRLSLPPEMLGQIQAWVQGKEIPAYKTQQDFVRDAIFHRLKFLAGWKGTPAQQKAIERSLYRERLAHLHEEMETNDEIVAGLRESINQARFSNNKKLIKDLCEAAETDLHTIPDPWREKIAATIQEARSWL